MRLRTTTSTLVAGAIIATAGCGGAHQGASTGIANAAGAAPSTPSQDACAAGIAAFNAVAKPLVQQDPAATATTAQYWIQVLGEIPIYVPGMSNAVATAFAREGSIISLVGTTAAAAEFDPVSYPWNTVMPPVEQRLDADFYALEKACQTVGVHT